MKKILAKITIITLVLATTLSIYPLNAEQGPRSEDLIIRYYSDVESAYAALKACDIDIVGYEITADLYQDAIEDPNICLGAVAGLDMYQFDINNNATIYDYPGIQSPTYGIRNWRFRKALTHLVDKTLIVNTFCAGFADRIDQPIAYIHRGWRNQSCWYEDGTDYAYNPALAAAEFDANGNVQGTTPNLDYNPAHPGSAQFIRTYPSDHPTHAGQDLHDLKVCIRTDDARRWQAGNALLNQLLMAGIPVYEIAGPPSVLYPIVMDERNYHIYTGGWSLERFPPLYLYYLYSGQFWYESGPNYVSGCLWPGDTIPPDQDPSIIDPSWIPVPGGDCESSRNYPLLDYYLYISKHFPTYQGAQSHIKKALGYGWCEMFMTIPLFSSRSYWAWKCNIKGVVCAEGVGPENKYNWMNCYNINGGPVVYGLKTAPLAMNIIYSSWYYDHQCLNKMNLYNEIDSAPYDMSIDQVGFISDWEVSTWVDPDDAEEKTLITECYRTDGYFAKPVTGDQGENVNNTHKYASIWYNYQIQDSWHNPSVKGIKTLRMIDCSYVKDGQTGVEIYWDTKSYWHLYQGVVPFLSFDWYALDTLSQTVTETLTSDVMGYLSTTEPVFWVISAEQGGTPLTVGVDYDIYMSKTGHTNRADVRIINPAHIGLPIDITYLAIDDATGYTPGNIPWDMSFEGAGMYYAVDFQAGPGGYLALKKNPWYPMETPPLGEIDFVKKPNGCYKIDIYDVVIAATSYGSQGGAVPSPNWFPGADLAPECCVVDIFDIVTITGKYGQTFDCDP